MIPILWLRYTKITRIGKITRIIKLNIFQYQEMGTEKMTALINTLLHTEFDFATRLINIRMTSLPKCGFDSY